MKYIRADILAGSPKMLSAAPLSHCGTSARLLGPSPLPDLRPGAVTVPAYPAQRVGTRRGEAFRVNISLLIPGAIGFNVFLVYGAVFSKNRTFFWKCYVSALTVISVPRS